MKSQVKRSNLAYALNIVGRMIKQRATLPILSNIMVSTDKGRLKIASTDLESAVITWIGAKVDEEGAVTIPARTLIDYISATSFEVVDVDVKGTDIWLKSNQNKAMIKGMGIEEFPIIPQVKSSNWIKVSAGMIKNAIMATSIAAALDETRPVLAGIYFKARGSELKAIATDSYRLAEYKMPIEKLAAPLDFIIPARVANELSRVLPSGENEEKESESDPKVEIAVGENQAEFKFDDIIFLSRQIEGSFPDYEQIIPKEFVYEFRASKDELAEALRSASVFARESGNNIKLTCTEGSVVVSAASAQVGDTEATLRVESSGTPLTVAYNAKYILDAINVVTSQEIKIAFSGALNPGLITGVGNDSYRYVIMPLRSE